MPVATLPRAEGIAFRANPRRVLIVSPHFPPINAPDHHRVRVALSHFAENGWQAEVLAVRPADVEGIRDPELAAALPAGCIVHRVAAWPVKWTRRFGWGSLARRSIRALRRAGDALLATGRFDLVFFSTTQFGLWPLAPEWKRRHGFPYVLDFQDEWVLSYYHEHPEVLPPGGRFKFAASQWLARRQEPEVVTQAAQIVSVSKHYLVRLKDRHPLLERARLHVLPFGGAESDFGHLARNAVRQDYFDPCDGRIHWVYAGAGGPYMQHAMRAFSLALARALAQDFFANPPLRVHLIGTSYAPAGFARKYLEPVAQAHGLQDIVREYPERAPYFIALQCLRQAHALIVLGSDDPGYTASKIYPYVLARRPLLAILHEESGVIPLLRETGAGIVIPFAPAGPPELLAHQIFEQWFASRAFEREPKTDWTVFAPFTAAAMTRQLAGIFDVAVHGRARFP